MAGLQVPIPLEPFFQVSLAPCWGILQESRIQRALRKSAHSQNPNGKFPGAVGIYFSSRVLCPHLVPPVTSELPVMPLLLYHTEKASSRLQHSVSKSQTPNWQSPSLVIWTPPLVSCVIFRKSVFLSLNFHLCEMGLIAMPS